MDLYEILHFVRTRRLANQFKQMEDGFRFAALPIMLDPSWERRERQVFRQLVNEVDLVVDIGANAGFYTCIARSAGKRVIAIEPLHENLLFLLGNLKVNRFDDVEVLPIALSSKISILSLYGYGDLASLEPGWAGAESTAARFVPVSTLDTVLGNRLNGQRLLLKVDVEGHESAMLLGAQAVLNSEPRPIWLLENLLVDASIPNSGVNPDYRRVFEHFWALSYDAYSLDGSLIDSETVDRWLNYSQEPSSSNFIFR